MEEPTYADLHVSPDGDDGNAGTAEEPLRTIEAARDRFQPQLADMARDLVVMVRGGTWYLEEPISFRPQDSGCNGFDVVYRNYPGETPVFVGGRPITNWQRRGENEWAAKVDGGWTFQQLFADGKRQTKARHPNQGYLHVESVDEDAPRQAFHYQPADIPEDWALGPEAQVLIWSGQDWFTDTVPIESVDRMTRKIRLRHQTLCRIVREDGYVGTRRYFIQGVHGALDAPGEFFLDEREGMLYWRPPCADIESMSVVASSVLRVFEFVGRSHEECVSHIRIEGLTIDVSRFGKHFTETKGTHGETIWHEPANREAAVYLEHAEHCAVRSCHVRNAGYNGITLNACAQHNEVYGNHIEEAGFHGVLIIGYAPRTGLNLDVNNHNSVISNHIHHCGRLVGHGAGLFIHSSGHNRIAHNLIHDLPRYGICSKGEHAPPEGQTFEQWMDANPSRHNVYEYNHVHHCNLDSEDSGMISFISTGPHNIVRNNLIHDNPRELDGLAFGIYLDDGAGYFTVSHNVICNLDGGGQGRIMPIYAKGIHNRIVNNVLICGPKAHAAIACAEMFGMLCYSHEWRRNIVYLEGDATHVWSFWNWNENRLAACDENLFWNAAGPCTVKVPGQDAEEVLSMDEWREYTDGQFDQHSLVADPMFVDAKNSDYRLHPDSPAHRLGIESIDISECGSLPDSEQCRLEARDATG